MDGLGRPSLLALTALAFLTGLLLAVQFRSQPRSGGIVSQGPADQAVVIGSLLERNAALRKEAARLEQDLAMTRGTEAIQAVGRMEEEVERLRLLTGLVPATGPGLRVEVQGKVGALDLQDLINELRNAGAEAIALNGQRIVVHSVVTREGTGLAVNGQRISSPYILEAIGAPDTLEKAVGRRGGLVTILEFSYPGTQITISRVEAITLAPYRGDYPFRWARPAD